MINAATNTVTATIPIGNINPWAVAVNPAGTQVYVTNDGNDSLSVISTATNTIINDPITGEPYLFLPGTDPEGAATLPFGNLALGGTEITEAGNGVTPGELSIYNPTTDSITGTVNVGLLPVAVVVA